MVFVNSAESIRYDQATNTEFYEVSAGIAEWQNTDIANKKFGTIEEAQLYIEDMAQELREDGYEVKVSPGELYARWTEGK